MILIILSGVMLSIHGIKYAMAESKPSLTYIEYLRKDVLFYEWHKKNSLFLGWVLLAALIFHLSLGIEFKQADAASNYFRVYPLSTSNDAKTSQAISFLIASIIYTVIF